MKSNFTRIFNSPFGAALRVALVVLLVEFSLMVAIDVLQPIIGSKVSASFWKYLDPILLTVIVSPVLYFAVLRPMKEQQLKLQRQKDELGIAAVTFNSQEGIVITDEKHKILKVNNSFTKITGYTSEEAVGKTPAILQSGRQNKEFYDRMKESLVHDRYWQGEIWNRRKNGEIYPEQLTITAVGESHGNINYVGIFSDITLRKVFEEKISFLAYHDRLTELPSRELFYDRLSHAISQARRKEGHLALLFLDLDGFKAVNDIYGHEAGDELLKTVAKRLLSCIRDEDTAARLGGDEFSVVLGEIRESYDVAVVAEKIIQKLSEPMLLSGGCECNIGASIGIAFYPKDGTEIDKLISAADRAMYRSKKDGRNNYSYSSDPAKNSPPWIALDSSHLLGISQMDQQHQALADKLNKLNESVKNNESNEIIVQLFDDVLTQIGLHFKNEELLMDRYGYADNNAHKNEHQRLISEAGFLKQKFIHGGELVVMQTLKEWLLNHVLDLDKQVATFLMRQGVK